MAFLIEKDGCIYNISVARWLAWENLNTISPVQSPSGQQPKLLVCWNREGLKTGEVERLIGLCSVISDYRLLFQLKFWFGRGAYNHSALWVIFGLLMKHFMVLIALRMKQMSNWGRSEKTSYVFYRLLSMGLWENWNVNWATLHELGLT